MRKILFTLTSIVFLFSGCNQKDQSEGQNNAIQFDELEFEMPAIQEPLIPDYSVSIVDFGAIEGGQQLNTFAFHDAIEAVTKRGGGKVIIPPGIWLTGPIILKNKLELHAQQGALVVFSTNKDLYPVIQTSFEGLDTWRCISPIYGKNVADVAFTGSGVWDGSGEVWRYVKKSKLTSSQWKKLVASGGVLNSKGTEWYPSEQFRKGAEMADMNVPVHVESKADFEGIRDYLRPVMVSIQNSKRVKFDGPVFQNSPAWCIHPLMVEHLIVRNLTVKNPWYSQNGDGIDIESCKNVLVEYCAFDVGDDAICIKSGKNEDGRRRGVPCENLVIRNNTVYHGHGGVTVGSEMSGGVRNMHVSNCTFIGTDVGLRFKSNRGRGGVVENIYMSHIRMTGIPTYAISFNLFYGGLSVSELLKEGAESGYSEQVPVTEETPCFKDIYMEDIVVKGALQGIHLQGLPEMKIQNVRFSNLLLESQRGITLIDGEGIDLDQVKLITRDDPAIQILNSSSVDVTALDYNYKSREAIKINGKGSEEIRLKAKGDKNLAGLTVTGEEVNRSGIRF